MTVDDFYRLFVAVPNQCGNTFHMLQPYLSVFQLSNRTHALHAEGLGFNPLPLQLEGFQLEGDVKDLSPREPVRVEYSD